MFEIVLGDMGSTLLSCLKFKMNDKIQMPRIFYFLEIMTLSKAPVSGPVSNSPRIEN